MSPDFIEIHTKQKEKRDRAGIIEIRADPIYKARLRKLAFQRHTTQGKILRAYLRYCLEKDGQPVKTPKEKGAYFPSWMKNSSFVVPSTTTYKHLNEGNII